MRNHTVTQPLPTNWRQKYENRGSEEPQPRDGRPEMQRCGQRSLASSRAVTVVIAIIVESK